MTRKYKKIIAGYKAINKPYFKDSYKNGYVLEHRYIYHIYLSIKYNRIIYSPKSYDVHHINGDKFDNRIQNLQLLSKSNHIRITPKTYKQIDVSNRFCNICKRKTSMRKGYKKYYEKWLRDINGWLCDICHSNIRNFNKKFDRDLNKVN